MKILIVGAGLYGSVCAYELRHKGHECYVIEKRDHVAGNIYTRYSEEAQCHEHMYGAHIFHTDSKKIWDYICKFSDFNNFTNRVKVMHKSSVYSFPINLMTLNQVYSAVTPEDGLNSISKDRLHNSNPSNMEEFCLSTIGSRLYSIFIEGYTQKQWGIHPSKLPSDIIKRIPFRLNYNDNYFNDRYQGIPLGGYTKIIEKMLENVKIELNTDFFSDRDKWLADFDLIIYTGEIDKFFDYKFGHLEYRSLRFEREILPVSDWQGNAVINYTDVEVPWTRIIEHKHFDLITDGAHTVITKEYPDNWIPGKTPFYPINDDKNNMLYLKYKRASEELKKVHFGGRLGSFKYLDMHQVIGMALSYCSKF